jgi:cobalt-zinc-cadmium efflux system protein
VTAPTLGQHAFSHAQARPRAAERRVLWWALGLNSGLLVVEGVGGVAFHSLALLADAAHLVSDVAGLGVAVLAVGLAARPVSARHSFGFARAEVLAALSSVLLLLGAGVWILVEGVGRVRHPVIVNGAGLATVASVGLLVNLGSSLLVHRAQGASLNMRASFVHLATDAVGSLGAIVAGLLILGWGWQRADPVVSLLTALLVLWAGWGLLLDTTHVLMEGTPRGLDPDAVRAVMLEVDTVADVHHLHLWNLASDIPALSAHVVVSGEPSLREAQRTSDQVKTVLADQFDVTNVTIELESAALRDVTAPPSTGTAVAR